VAKRFTATEKWEDSWFHSLPPKHKLLWFYMLDKCDNAGVFELNLPLASFNIGQTITTEEFQKYFGGKVVPLSETKLWIPKFIEFQYKCAASELNEHNKAHLSVLLILRKYGLPRSFEAPSKPLGSPFEGAKDKDTDTDKDKEKDKDVRAKTEKIRYADDVYMTAGEYTKLVEKVGEEKTTRAIAVLDNYKGSSGKRYKSDYKAILSWVINRVEEEDRKAHGTQGRAFPNTQSAQHQRATFRHGEAELGRLRDLEATLEERVRDRDQRARPDSLGACIGQDVHKGDCRDAGELRDRVCTREDRASVRHDP